MVQVERGVVNKGDEVEVLGIGSGFKTVVTGIGTLDIALFASAAVLT